MVHLLTRRVVQAVLVGIDAVAVGGLAVAPVGLLGAAVTVGALPIRTPMAAERLDDPAQVEWLTGRVPPGRVGEPTEIGEIAAFLVLLRAVVSRGVLVDLDVPWPTRARIPGEKVGNWAAEILTYERAHGA